MKRVIEVDIDQAVEQELKDLRAQVKKLETKVQGKDFTISMLKSTIAENKAMVDAIKAVCDEYGREW